MKINSSTHSAKKTSNKTVFLCNLYITAQINCLSTFNACSNCLFPCSDGAQQYITLPLSMMSGGVLGKMAINDPAATAGGSSSSTNVPKTASTTSASHRGVATNGRESPSSAPIELIIKKENVE